MVRRVGCLGGLGLLVLVGAGDRIVGIWGRVYCILSSEAMEFLESGRSSVEEVSIIQK